MRYRMSKGEAAEFDAASEPEAQAPDEVLVFVCADGKPHPEMFVRYDFDADELVSHRDLATALQCTLVRYRRADLPSERERALIEAVAQLRINEMGNNRDRFDAFTEVLRLLVPRVTKEDMASLDKLRAALDAP